MHREVIFGEEARNKMKQGVDWVANTVKATMGVNGKSVVLDTNPYGRPLITNDGVTIARDLIKNDRTDNIGAKLIRIAAEATNDNAGDGTTTTMILMQSIIELGIKAMANGASGIELRKGITDAVRNVVDSLRSEQVKASDLETLANVATISCRDSELGKLIAEVILQAGTEGMVTIEDRFEADTVYEKHEGLRLTGGYPHESFINLPERQQTSFSDVPILVTDRVFTMGEEMARIMETVANMGKKEAVIIAAGIEGAALATAYANWKNRAIFILPIRVMAYGDLGQGMLKDVAAITGATYLDEHEKTIMDVTADDFGRAAKIIADKHDTTIVSDNDTLKAERVKELTTAKENANEYEQENLSQRIAKLSSGVFTVKVGGKTETERNELKTRVDDAIKAAKAALEEGVVAGGGSALYRAAVSQHVPDVTTDFGIGQKILFESCKRPIEQMAENSNLILDRSDLTEILDKAKAIDFSVGKVVKAFDAGIVDPLKVVLECIENSAGQSGIFLTIENAVHDVIPEKAESI